MKITIKALIAAGLLLSAVSPSAIAQKPETPQNSDTTADTTQHKNGVTYEGYYESEFRLTDPISSGHASGADDIAREDTLRKFHPRDYNTGLMRLHRKARVSAVKGSKHKA